MITLVFFDSQSPHSAVVSRICLWPYAVDDDDMVLACRNCHFPIARVGSLDGVIQNFDSGLLAHVMPTILLVFIFSFLFSIISLNFSFGFVQQRGADQSLRGGTALPPWARDVRCRSCHYLLSFSSRHCPDSVARALLMEWRPPSGRPVALLMTGSVIAVSNRLARDTYMCYQGIVSLTISVWVL